MKRGVVLGAAVAVAAAAALLWFLGGSGPAPPSPRLPGAPDAVHAPAPPPPFDDGRPPSLPRGAGAVVTVVGIDGHSIRGALVEARPMPATTAPFSVLRTDAAGRATFEDLAPATWIFRARSPGRGGCETGPLLLVRGAAREVRILLGRACSLEGTVMDAAGRACPGASILAGPTSPWMRPPLPEARSDASGRYRFEDLPEGAVCLWATREGGIPSFVGSVLLPHVSRFDIVLAAPEEGAAVAGTVTEDGTGAPIHGATVTVSVPTEAGTPTTTTTDAEGNYRIGGLEPGLTVLVDASAPGAVPSGAEAAHSRWLPLPPGGVLRRDFRLRRGALVTGVVRDAGGSPVGGADVRLFGASAWQRPMEARTRTAPSGEFRLAGLAAGRALLEVRAKEGSALPPPPPSGEMTADRWRQNLLESLDPAAGAFEVPVEGEVRRDVVLATPATVRGTVVDSDDIPVPGAIVRQGVRDPDGDTPVAAAMDDGTFALTAIPGPLVLVAEAPGHSPARSEPREVRPGEVVAGILLRLPREGRVRGTVRAHGGGSVAGALVRVACGDDPDPPQPEQWPGLPAFPAAPDGSFEVSFPVEGPHLHVRAEAAGFEPDFGPPLEAMPGGSAGPADLVLRPRPTLRGTVHSTATGLPVPGARVAVGGIDAWGGASAVTGAGGTFEVPTPADRGFDLDVSADGYARFHRYFESPVRETTLGLDPATPLEGRVEDPDGVGVPGLEVVARHEELPYPLRRPTGPDGSFRFPSLRPGRYVLDAASPRGNGEDWLVAKVKADVPGPPVVLLAKRGLGISGILLDEEGRGLPGIPIKATGREVQAEAMTDAEGCFRIPGLPAGTFDVTGGYWGAGFLPPLAEGVPAGTTDLVLTALRGETIEGTVVDEEGRPVTAVPFRVSAIGGDDHRVVVYTRMDGAGRFRFTGLPAGAYSVHVDLTQATGLVPSAVLDVAAGRRDVVLRLRTGSVIAGTLLDERGRPVRDGSVIAWPAGIPFRPDRWPGSGEAGESFVDGSGRFEVKGLLAGRSYDVIAGGTGGWSAAGARAVPAGTEDLRFVLRKGAGRLRGTLRDAAGEPVGEVVVGIFEGAGLPAAFTSTWTDGTFELEGLPAGPVALSAVIPDRGPEPVPLGTFDPAAGEASATLPPEAGK
ncbi:MAG: carboxypeptidase-like regulatory domain-containing protein [Planctomycetes bacterium]|nr:carboxypeptidase-like regulatory domain-containing protein [Planctomycetota bacterium]